MIKYPCATKKGFMVAGVGDGLVMDRPNRARGTVQLQKAPTLVCTRGGGVGTVTDELKIRYLTEKECFRLMGFVDSDIDRIMAAVPSQAQRYKIAGNSIVVNCLEDIFKGMFIDQTYDKPKPKQTRLQV